ncbi:hypothetical protein QZH41_006216 [Actinostola sp. cb2023]|nr:hypothetical protein QZH41_006216 [Actinostola sp. cb2023]
MKTSREGMMKPGTSRTMRRMKNRTRRMKRRRGHDEASNDEGSIETIYEILGSPTSPQQVFDKDIVYTRFFKAKLNERLADKTKGMSCNTLLGVQPQVRANINKLIDAILGWKKYVKKVRMEQNRTRQWQERKTMLSPEDKIKMKACPHAVYCNKLLHGSREEPYSLEQAVDMRNYLIFKMCIENGSRAGPIHAITVTDVKNNERLEGKRVIHVVKHKTTTSYGGALLNVSDDLYLDIWRFIRGGRRVFFRAGQHDDDSVFLGQYGNGLSPSYIHCTLKDFARKTNLVDDDVLEHFSSTMVRKICVTHTREQSAAAKTNIASLMVHSLGTAERSYSLQNRILQCSSGHDTVRALFGSPVKSSDQGANDDSSVGTNTIPPSPFAKGPLTSLVSTTRRAVWSKTDENVIIQHASAIISGLGEATKANILKTIPKSEPLREIASREGEDRLFEKIKALKKKYTAQH